MMRQELLLLLKAVALAQAAQGHRPVLPDYPDNRDKGAIRLEILIAPLQLLREEFKESLALAEGQARLPMLLSMVIITGKLGRYSSITTALQRAMNLSFALAVAYSIP